MAEKRLANQVAIVTGASKGIGRAIAASLAAEGARLIVAARGAAELAAAADEINAGGGEAIAVRADVTNEEDVERMVATALERHGRVDVLVNNAGIEGTSRLLAEIDLASWRRVIDGNLTSTAICCRAVLPSMQQAGYGRIINLSSRVGLAGHVIGGRAGTWNQVDYVAAKAGVTALTKALALEVARQGITVNAVAPGPIRTPMLSRVGEEETARRLALIPVGRLGEPEDIAHAVVFLALPESGFITGQTISVNGGTWMG